MHVIIIHDIHYTLINYTYIIYLYIYMYICMYALMHEHACLGLFIDASGWKIIFENHVEYLISSHMLPRFGMKIKECNVYVYVFVDIMIWLYTRRHVYEHTSKYRATLSWQMICAWRLMGWWRQILYVFLGYTHSNVRLNMYQMDSKKKTG